MHKPKVVAGSRCVWRVGSLKGSRYLFSGKLQRRMATMAAPSPPAAAVVNDMPESRIKLTGRAFYESIGSPKVVLAPMVDQSEFVSSFQPDVFDLF